MQLYRVILTVIYGGTIGKRVLKIKILTVNGEYMTFIQSLIRMSPYLLLSLISVLQLFVIIPYVSTMVKVIQLFYLVEIIALIVNKQNRTIHDLMAGTYVISDDMFLVTSETDADTCVD